MKLKNENNRGYQRNIRLLYLISLLQGMVLYGPIATLYRQAEGVSVFQITLIESMSLALCIALEVPWGMIADRIGYRKTMIISCVLYVLSKIVFWRADGFGGFLLERLMLSVAMAGISGCDVSILYLSCRGRESQHVFGVYNFLNTAGLLAAALVYSVFIGENYRMAGLLTVFTYGAAAVLAFGLTEVKEKGDKSRKHVNMWAVFKELLPDGRFFFLLIGMACFSETNQTVTVFLNQLQYTRSHIQPAVMGYIYILVTVIGMAGVWSGRLMRRMGERTFAFMAFGMGAGACLVMAFTANPFLSVAGIMLLRLAYSLFAPLQTELQNRHVQSADRATVLSLYAVLMEGSGVFTNLIFGKAASMGVPTAMGTGVFFCVAGAASYLWWKRGGKARGYRNENVRSGRI